MKFEHGSNGTFVVFGNDDDPRIPPEMELRGRVLSPTNPTSGRLVVKNGLSFRHGPLTGYAPRLITDEEYARLREYFRETTENGVTYR